MRVVFLAALLSAVAAVDRSKFRTCKDTGFCRRHRAPAPAPPKFKVLRDSVASHGLDGISAILQGEQLESPPLKLTIKFYDSGVARIQVVLIKILFSPKHLPLSLSADV